MIVIPLIIAGGWLLLHILYLAWCSTTLFIRTRHPVLRAMQITGSLLRLAAGGGLVVWDAAIAIEARELVPGDRWPLLLIPWVAILVSIAGMLAAWWTLVRGRVPIPVPAFNRRPQ